MYTRNVNVDGNQFVLNANIRADQQRDVILLSISATKDSFSFFRTYNIRNISERQSVVTEFREQLSVAYTEYLNVLSFLTDMGFVEVVAEPNP